MKRLLISSSVDPAGYLSLGGAVLKSVLIVELTDSHGSTRCDTFVIVEAGDC